MANERRRAGWLPHATAEPLTAATAPDAKERLHDWADAIPLIAVAAMGLRGICGGKSRRRASPMSNVHWLTYISTNWSGAADSRPQDVPKIEWL